MPLGFFTKVGATFGLRKLPENLNQVTKQFHKDNLNYLNMLSSNPFTTPICPVYFRSRKYLLFEANNGNYSVDTPANKKLYVTKEELIKFPEPKDYLLANFVEAVERFPDPDEQEKLEAEAKEEKISSNKPNSKL